MLEKIKDILKRQDADKNGCLDFLEFYKMMGGNI